MNIFKTEKTLADVYLKDFTKTTLLVYIIISYLVLCVLPVIFDALKHFPNMMFLKAIFFSLLSIFLITKTYGDFLLTKYSLEDNNTESVIIFCTHIAVNITNIIFHFITIYVS